MRRDVGEEKGLRKITKPRPGHADLVGGMKYRFDDLFEIPLSALLRVKRLCV